MTTTYTYSDAHGPVPPRFLGLPPKIFRPGVRLAAIEYGFMGIPHGVVEEARVVHSRFRRRKGRSL